MLSEGEEGDGEEGVDDEVDDDGMALGAEWFGLEFGLIDILVEDRGRETSKQNGVPRRTPNSTRKLVGSESLDNGESSKNKNGS